MCAGAGISVSSRFLVKSSNHSEVAIDRPCPSCLNLFRFGFPKLSRHFEGCLYVSRFSFQKLLDHFEYLDQSGFVSQNLLHSSYFLMTLETSYPAFSLLKTNCLRKRMTDLVQQEERKYEVREYFVPLLVNRGS